MAVTLPGGSKCTRPLAEERDARGLRQTSVKLGRLAITLTGIVFLAACASPTQPLPPPTTTTTSSPSPTTATVIGNLMGRGGPAPGTQTAPISGTVTVTRTEDGHVVSTVRVGTNGSFLLYLAPGAYRFTADCQTTATEPTAITARTTTNVTLWCAMA